MALSGGALAISIAFIHDVAKNPHERGVLGVAWVSFAASLCCVLVSFLTSERAILKMAQEMDNEAEETTRGRITDYLNWASAGAFLVGVLFLVIFALLNI